MVVDLETQHSKILLLLYLFQPYIFPFEWYFQIDLQYLFIRLLEREPSSSEKSSEK
jgi:hypothetical protein